MTVTTSKQTFTLPIVLPDPHGDPNEPYVSPPSPVPTEIVEDVPEQSPEEIMEAAKATGVKVRDFAHEPRPLPDIRAPELFRRPLEALILHDRYIRVRKKHKAYKREFGKEFPRGRKAMIPFLF